MKAPLPVPPRGAPEGTVWTGGPIEWFGITLRIRGDDLVPDEITDLLGCSPNRCQTKGEPTHKKDGSVRGVAGTGSWRLSLKREETDEWDCAEAMMELLQRLPTDVSLWQSLAKRFKIDFFVGLRMTSRNKGFSISSQVMGYLAERGIEAGFDIYARDDAEEA